VPGDVQALADALGTYVEDAARRVAHGLAGRAHVETSYGVDTMVGHYAALYDDCRRRRHP
jgi:glycosyltransferase involved in cell wall biosynthesis